jgi:Protein kinase domain
MMRETSLDEEAASDGLEKSLAMGSISFSQHRQSVRLQRDIENTPDHNTTAAPTDTSSTVLPKDRDGICSRNELDEARTTENQSRVTDEEKKQDEDLASASASTVIPVPKVQTRILPPQQAQPRSHSPQQDYLRHVATDGQKRAGTSWWERVVVQRSSYVVEDLVEQYTADSQFLHSDPFSVAWLDRIELETGDLLGSGTYSNVSRVQKLELLPDFLKDHPEQCQLRRELVARSINSSDSGEDEGSGYAIKHLKAELLQNSKLFEAAAADLIMEAKFLARLSHPNILRLRGMALGGSSAFATTGLFDSYFLVVDELEETLIQRIQMWKIQGSTDQYQHNMILYKLKLAVQVASALAYLHERRLVFRDLKPHNVGLKRDGTIQLFDFGFCRELPDPSTSVSNQGSRNKNVQKQPPSLPPEHPPSSSSREDDDDEKLFCMSGKGTLL